MANSPTESGEASETIYAGACIMLTLKESTKSLSDTVSIYAKKLGSVVITTTTTASVSGISMLDRS